MVSSRIHGLSLSLLAIVAFFSVANQSALAQKTINVPADQPTIQAGINAANNGDTVLVAPGTYPENINFQGKLITVTSSGGPSVTTIDGGHAGSVVTFNNGELASAVIKGFTIQNGSAQFLGGGVFIQFSAPMIVGNIIRNNISCGGGGGIESESGSPQIQGNTIANNGQLPGCSGGGGAGIEVDSFGTNGFPQITGNWIVNNSWDGFGGGILLNSAEAAVITNNVIASNSGVFQGGGIAIWNASAELIAQNLIYNNSSDQGGGIYFDIASGGLTLVNNTIFGNAGGSTGSAVYAAGFDSQVQFFNNLMIGLSGEPALFCGGSVQDLPTFANNDAFSPGAIGYDGTCAGQAGQNGNVSVDPQFLNASAGDFHLLSSSPVVDAGTNAASSLPKTDFDGNPRILDGNNDCVSTVDMGAFELVRHASLSLSTNSLTFAGQVVGTSSSAQVVSLTNNGNTCFQISKTQITGDFSQSISCPAAGLPAGSACFYDVTFTPTALGLRTGTLTISGSDGVTPSSPTVSLSGTGLTPPAVSLSTTSVNFGFQPMQTSGTQSITLTNTGQGPLNIIFISASAPFSQTNNCPVPLAGGASCIINASFTPIVSGAQSGTLTISDNAAGSPQSVSLNGTGVDFSLSASPSSVTVRRGQSIQLKIGVAPVAGPFNSSVSLSCGALPDFSSCSFAPLSVIPGATGASSVLTFSTSSKTPHTTVTIAVFGVSGGLVHFTKVTFTIK